MKRKGYFVKIKAKSKQKMSENVGKKLKLPA